MDTVSDTDVGMVESDEYPFIIDYLSSEAEFIELKAAWNSSPLHIHYSPWSGFVFCGCFIVGWISTEPTEPLAYSTT